MAFCEDGKGINTLLALKTNIARIFVLVFFVFNKYKIKIFHFYKAINHFEFVTSCVNAFNAQSIMKSAAEKAEDKKFKEEAENIDENLRSIFFDIGWEVRKRNITDSDEAFDIIKSRFDGLVEPRLRNLGIKDQDLEEEEMAKIFAPYINILIGSHISMIDPLP